ncbi:MAG: hypothetical protein JOZ15_18235 [Acidobacteria bacterium]|nr:hypothetical protein [Acidobacteriota bacterium]
MINETAMTFGRKLRQMREGRRSRSWAGIDLQAVCQALAGTATLAPAKLHLPSSQGRRVEVQTAGSRGCGGQTLWTTKC